MSLCVDCCCLPSFFLAAFLCDNVSLQVCVCVPEHDNVLRAGQLSLWVSGCVVCDSVSK